MLGKDLNVAVIGGSGFIGTRLVNRLLAAGHTVRIVDKADSRAYPALVRKADVRDEASLRTTLEGCDAVYNLAAEHRDDVSPRSLYDEVNVGGARNVCSAASALGINRIVFTSSVAVYGFAPAGTDEKGSFKPFNDYGRTKMEAETVFREWFENDAKRALTIVRPTVVFGERNRGNVYNLLNQMSGGRFIMVGKGKNTKSMAYVENAAAFLQYALEFGPGHHVFNYIDKPDFDMEALVLLVRRMMGRGEKIGLRLPYWLGYLGGLSFDALAAMTRRKYPISAIRVKKFCSTTCFASTRIQATGFVPPVSLGEGLERTVRFEFLDKSYAKDDHVFVSE